MPWVQENSSDDSSESDSEDQPFVINSDLYNQSPANE